DSYVFEVGSAGADRELKRERDFDEFMGSEVEVRLYQPQDGSKRFVGTLAGYDNGAVSILLPDKSTRRFEKNQIAQVRLAVSIGG
ncbi:MAG: ribosome maturation factor RimP, partial [Oscillospiraceae bacterium]|nr:ribosome maturation factor RimP [Oscillospiraceae bacterium]